MAEPLAAAGIGPTAMAASRQRELLLWTALSIAALAIAGIFALLLAVSRIPGIEAIFPWPVGFFHKGLVIHVVFSFVVWFLAVLGALTTLLPGSPDRDRIGPDMGRAVPGGLGVLGVLAASPMLFLPALFDRGEASLNNYVPVIIDPLYYAGLIVLLAGVGLSALRFCLNARVRDVGRAPLIAAVAAASIAYLAALLCLAVALWLLRDTATSDAFNEDLFWGGGHLLQFVNTSLLIAAWYLLVGRIEGARVPAPVPLLAAAALLTLFAVPAPLLYGLSEPFSIAQRQAFTYLQYVLGIAGGLAAWSIAAALPRWRPGADPGHLALALSLLLFFVGGALGLFVDGADTRTPAHYHGVIAAVTLAFMGVFYRVLLPSLGRAQPSARWQRTQIHLFAWGQLTACLGLFLAGGHGAPRKVAGSAQGLEGFAQILGLGMNGLGGLVAVIGGGIFVVLMIGALIRGAEYPPAAAVSRL